MHVHTVTTFPGLRSQSAISVAPYLYNDKHTTINTG